jgi:phosphomethylpyrimidine synthase
MTQRTEALKGIVTPEMEQAAQYEGLDPEFIRAGLAEGTIAVPKNAAKTLPHVRAVGKGLKTKINANIGSSPYHMDMAEEIDKLHAAVKYGADAVMDLSLGSEIIEIRREIIRQSPVMVGTVPIYQTAFELSASQREITDMTIGDFLKTVQNQAEEGVDFMTIHSGVTLQSLSALENQGRILDVVSRGGSFLVSWMK